MRQDPVMLFCFHRSGSTLLTRMLNSNPNQLIVWGEHGGFLNGLRTTAQCAWSRLFQSAHRDNPEMVRHDSESKFIPFMNGFTIDDLRSNMRDMIARSFSNGIPATTRWGFKELRYASWDMTDWLANLFPKSQLIFLLRDPIELTSSSIRAGWVLERLARGENGYTSNKLPDVVYNILARIVTHDRIAQAALKRWGPNRVLIQHYEDTVEDPLGQMNLTSKFLNIKDLDERHIATTIGNKVGVATKFNADTEAPELHPDAIKQLAYSMYERVVDDMPPIGCNISSKWNFAVGVMPNDMYSFDTKVPECL